MRTIVGDVPNNSGYMLRFTQKHACLRIRTKPQTAHVYIIIQDPLRSGAQTRGVMQEKPRIVTEKLHGWAQFVR